MRIHMMSSDAILWTVVIHWRLLSGEVTQTIFSYMEFKPLYSDSRTLVCETAPSIKVTPLSTVILNQDSLNRQLVLLTSSHQKNWHKDNYFHRLSELQSHTTNFLLNITWMLHRHLRTVMCQVESSTPLLVTLILLNATSIDLTAYPET